MRRMKTLMVMGGRRGVQPTSLLVLYCSLVTLCSLLLLLALDNNNKYSPDANLTSSNNRRLNDNYNDNNNNNKDNKDNNKHPSNQFGHVDVANTNNPAADVRSNNNSNNNNLKDHNTEARQTQLQRTFDHHQIEEDSRKKIFFQNKNLSKNESRNNVALQNESRNNVGKHINESLNNNPYDHKNCRDQGEQTTSNNNNVRRQNIPRTAHIVWFYKNSTTFRFHQALSLLSLQRFFKPSKILFWYDTLPTGAWWLFACQSVAHLLFVPLQRPRRIFNWSVSVPEHQSDVARIQLLKKYGGLYIDLDVILVRDLAPLLSHDVTMGAETPEILGSGFIMSRPNATFLQLWLDSYRSDFDDSDWNKHSTKVPMELAKRHPDLVHVEWFSINRPNWFERNWLFEEGRLWDWSSNFAVHLWYREHKVEYSPQTIRRLNTTVAEIFRFIYYQSPKILPD